MAQIEFYDENLDKTFLVDESELPDKSFAITKDNCREHFYNWYRYVAKYKYLIDSLDIYNEIPIKYLEYLGVKIKPEWIKTLSDICSNKEIHKVLTTQIKNNDLNIEDAYNNLLNLYIKQGIPVLKPYNDWWYESD